MVLRVILAAYLSIVMLLLRLHHEVAAAAHPVPTPHPASNIFPHYYLMM